MFLKATLAHDCFKGRTGKHLCQSLFFNKVAGLSLQLYEKRDSAQMFPCEFCEKIYERVFLSVKNLFAYISSSSQIFHSLTVFFSQDTEILLLDPLNCIFLINILTGIACKTTQQTLTCSNPTIETLEKGVKYVQI